MELELMRERLGGRLVLWEALHLDGGARGYSQRALLSKALLSSAPEGEML